MIGMGGKGLVTEVQPKNFWALEQPRGLGFTRAMMPEGAASTGARAIVLVDAAMEMIMLGVWIGFPLRGGGWSCQHLIGRIDLADENSTIPKKLQGLTSGSTIALSWTMAEMKPLAMYHKNRVIQIRRGTFIISIVPGGFACTT